jgi:hypothetical protein
MALVKPLSELTADDLAMFELWEIASDVESDDDQPRVRPVGSDVVPVDEDDVVYRVACDVVLANGRVLSGHVGVCNGALDAAPPLLVDDTGRAFDLGHAPPHDRLATCEALLGVPFALAFPLRWQLRLPLAGEAAYREGELPLPPEGGARLH